MTSALEIESVALELLKTVMLKLIVLNLDGQVNNAGVAELGKFDSKTAISIMKVNYIGTKNTTDAMLPLLKPSDAGARIIFISSLVSQLVVSICSILASPARSSNFWTRGSLAFLP
jgi:NAD(P)-dependent dehydrogenase (short-subunit alcohol dehydrogenase family)